MWESGYPDCANISSFGASPALGSPEIPPPRRRSLVSLMQSRLQQQYCVCLPSQFTRGLARYTNPLSYCAICKQQARSGKYLATLRWRKRLLPTTPIASKRLGDCRACSCAALWLSCLLSSGGSVDQLTRSVFVSTHLLFGLTYWLSFSFCVPPIFSLHYRYGI